jgi:hydroxyethylthiazole kinase-like uncharacterized protein yjeF
MNPNYRCTVAQAKRKPIPEWTAKDAARYIRVPSKTDDKYSHGVLGMVTGSKRYPGAAILGAEAAHHTGIGMVRYLGPKSVARLVFLRRPEVVTVPGKVNAWLIGSGIDARHRSWREKRRMLHALHSGLPVVVDAGALDLIDEARGSVVITPHARELARLLRSKRAPRAAEFTSTEALTDVITADPTEWSEYAADQLDAVVLLKGHTTHIVEPMPKTGTRFHVKVTSPTTWLATAGSGDILAGILGALLATHPEARDELPQLAATAVWLHGAAAAPAGGQSPFPADAISTEISKVRIKSQRES